MRRMKERILSLVLTFVMVVSLFTGMAPVEVHADTGAHSHSICGDTCEYTTHDGHGAAVSWEAFTTKQDKVYTNADFGGMAVTGYTLYEEGNQDKLVDANSDGIILIKLDNVYPYQDYQEEKYTTYELRFAEGATGTYNLYLDADIMLNHTILVPAGVTLNLCLNGHLLNGHGASTLKHMLFYVNKGATLNICDCNNQVDRTSSVSGTSWYPSGVTITGGVIANGTDDTYATNADHYAGIINNKGTLNLYGGTIAGSVNVPAVCNLNTFNMYGGAFIGNSNTYTSPGDGAAIESMSISDDVQTITNIYAGKIMHNYAVNGGSAILASGGVTNIYGGEITNNGARNNGAVLVNATLYLYGGTISNNYGGSGAGIYSDGTIHLYGGKITNNETSGNGGGVYAFNDEGVYVGGNLVVKDNTRGDFEMPSNIYISAQSMQNNRTTNMLQFSTEYPLTSGAEIGVSTKEGNTLIAYRPAEADAVAELKVKDMQQYFFSDSDQYVIGYQSDITVVDAYNYPYPEMFVNGIVLGANPDAKPILEKIEVTLEEPAAGNAPATTVELKKDGESLEGVTLKSIKWFDKNENEFTGNFDAGTYYVTIELQVDTENYVVPLERNDFLYLNGSECEEGDEEGWEGWFSYNASTGVITLYMYDYWISKEIDTVTGIRIDNSKLGDLYDNLTTYMTKLVREALTINTPEGYSVVDDYTTFDDWSIKNYLVKECIYYKSNDDGKYYKKSPYMDIYEGTEYFLLIEVWADNDVSFSEDVKAANGFIIMDRKSSSLKLGYNLSNPPVVEYTITFDAQGGTLSETSATTVGSKLESLPTPTREGEYAEEYTFKGWFTEAEGGEEITVDTVYEVDTTIYAQWTRTHTMTLHAAKAPTCTEPGNDAYYVCDVCGGLFEDEEGTITTTLEEVTKAALEHSWATEWSKDKINHWHKCNNEGCTVTKDSAAHVDENEDNACDVCGYEKETEDVPPVETPVITGQPQNATAKEGEKATFTVKATGDDLTYQWMIDRNDGKGFVNLTNSTTATHTTTVVDMSCNGFKYKCVISNSAGSVTTNVVTLTVTEKEVVHTHDLTLVAAKAATCTETGNKAYYTCSGCDSLFTDAEGTTTTTAEAVKIAALGHDWSGEWTIIKEATATEEGKKVTYCVRECGQKKVAVIPIEGEEDDDDNGNIEKDAEIDPDAPVEEATIDNKKDELLEGDIFTEEEKELIEAGEEARVWLEIGKTDEDAIAADDKAKIEKEAVNIMGDDAKITYFEADLFKQVGNGDKTEITEPGVDIKITIIIPEELLNQDKTITREYKIIRLHEGEVDVISGTFDPATGEFSFKTDRFSTYAIVYDDVPVDDADEKDDVPDTGVVGVSSYAAALTLISGLGLVFCTSKKKSNE